MFQSFTGNSRRPRQVNLSGRNLNPFANNGLGGGFGPGPPQSLGGSQTAVANAQHDRIARQQERERTKAATIIQKAWRGAATRRGLKDARRRRWDEVEADGGDSSEYERQPLDGSKDWMLPVTPPYPSADQALLQVRLLLQFMTVRDATDLRRYTRLVARLHRTVLTKEPICSGGAWPSAYLQLQDICLAAISWLTTQDYSKFASILEWLVQQCPAETVANSTSYYKTMAVLVRHDSRAESLLRFPLSKAFMPASAQAYQDFALYILTLPHLHDIRLNGAAATSRDALKSLVTAQDPLSCVALATAVAELLRRRSKPAEKSTDMLKDDAARLWLLSNLIHIFRCQHVQDGQSSASTSNADFVFAVATLLASLADVIKVEPATHEEGGDDDSSHGHSALIDSFPREQISSLVNKESIGSLLKQNTSLLGKSKSQDKIDVGILSSYILTLLRLFPQRGDEIRMWIYMEPIKSTSSAETSSQMPIIRYFWQGLSNTSIFHSIFSDAKAAIPLLKSQAPASSSQSSRTSTTTQEDRKSTDDEWRIIFLFVEMYTFVLKVMDDEEFFAGERVMPKAGAGKSGNLLLPEIQALTTFLKHLGFTMYYNAADISGDVEGESTKAISSFFRVSAAAPSPVENDANEKTHSVHIAGVHGMSLDHVKGLVTGLLRAIYGRDSRRPFLPIGHWLMTSRFDMTNFISAVVEEEERRHKVQEEDAEDTEDSDMTDIQAEPRLRLAGTGRAERTIRIAQLQRQHRKASRRRYLQAVAPRLEIIQNMPFLIPFATRVQIFREFVLLDQSKRRSGHMDPDMWRFAQANGTLMGRQTVQRHHAKIRREHEFEDAYDQFYDLGEGLKEPIQITFMDKFDTQEAGIDGGGVTKEFLTSVTSQAFAPTDGIDMFVENDQHLLYPNPAAMDEQKELLRDAGFLDDSVEFRDEVLELQRRYEFLGRIIGKCLYEGILVDIRFAGFFLLKWSLGSNGYKANINDLREFDEGLYQGLVSRLFNILTGT